VCVCVCVTNADTRRSSTEGNTANSRLGLNHVAIVSLVTLVWGCIKIRNCDHSLQNLVGHKLDVVSAGDDFV
jgi:hypothetical protein